MREPNQRGLSNEDQLKEKIIETGRILGRHGFVTFLGSYAPGNISARVPDSQRVLITPSGLAKNTLRKREICVIDLNGKLIGGMLRATSETPTHLAIYRRRSDVNAIIHTHPTYSTAFAIAKKKIPVVTIEMAGLVGSEVPVARFLVPGTRELGKEVVRSLRDGLAVLLQNHGLITVGSTLDEALNTTMATEENARLAYLAATFARPKTIPKIQVSRIRQYIQTEYGQR
jgi:L-ribulose-5-phosphate 4-epimerase